MFHVHRVLLISAVLLIPSVALGNVVAYEGLGPANTWGAGGNWFGYYPGSSFTIAQKFTPTVSGTLEEIYAAITPDMYTSDRSYTLRLLADASNVPGTALWQTTSQVWPVADGAIFHLDSLGGPWLTAGQSYWLQADKPVVLGSAHGWSLNDQGYSGSFAWSSNGGAWQVFDNDVVRGMRVLVAVPEPATVSLLLGGLMVLLRRRRK
jgi:hypothetical protein